MNKNLMIAGVVGLVILIGGGYFFMQSQTKPSSPDATLMEKTASPTEAVMEKESTEGATMEKVEVKEFDVVGTPFSFDVKEIKVKKGDTVRINYTNGQGLHDWTVDEFNARTKQLQAGQSETIEFVADKVGEFEYYCSVGNHRQQGMVGTLIVE
ncbi:cupredoxin domain-containing protein [Candidatus Gottesmanbacteria bacterium]|nr:cupredoxin domain-containing protein [Candidatus Gottesmanbacteria bacterium]